ncbi:hypothetical protein [Streptomyces sp. NPDC001820]|uniref:hypothetical protein n=1 Tax=Streptomyces sp. NPDC001820 TaxID=3364613 RepID=UPI00369FEEAA
MVTALDNLARIVQDNIAAQMVFSSAQDVADALKGKEDQLSKEILPSWGVLWPALQPSPKRLRRSGYRVRVPRQCTRRRRGR